ncbi:DUF1810 family protein [Sphingomonas sp. LM7]|uniref:DUF1810 family protein n=1 Tax=Sphingomonas sp. LM7 TaxID=1938607 RepID=UPI000983D76B|nr:DUF1810 family protein [Sphingomonas sp. LM7]AQR72896.1 hypothetical protein BXU08_03690 [Sphingomonas sp. LM7]
MQAEHTSYERALGEIGCGAKRTRWTWYISPGIAGLGSSPTAQRYAIRSVDEARAYLAHPLLSTRYAECVSALHAYPKA